jgi:hypothetical protein
MLYAYSTLAAGFLALTYAHKCKKSSRLRRTEHNVGDAAGAIAVVAVPDLDDGDLDDGDMIVSMTTVVAPWPMCQSGGIGTATIFLASCMCIAYVRVHGVCRACATTVK